jgi:phage shock protein PspC (stress-responsive transcriptional regulator)|tara:strand:- start:253 stop:501 length:249 start_codon:yes stop_codon:yes gene_type:complete
MIFKLPILNRILHFFERNAFGVCEWLGKKFGVNPSIFRKFFIYISFIALGSPFIIYFLLAFFLENKDKLKPMPKRKTVWDLK